ncbi:Uncharacterised protein [Acinetobacter baumannii]|nr:Uncharacterised protein [Acinetobacter baumannii]
MLLIEKSFGKVDNFIDVFVMDIRPWKGKLDACGAVGVITSIGTITNDKQLNKTKQPLPCPIGFTNIALRLIESFGNFHTAFFQLDLYQRQTIDQERDIKTAGSAIIVAVVDGDLIGDLIDIFAWVIRQEKKVFTGSIIKFDWEQITQILGAFKHCARVQKTDDLFPFRF